MPGFVFDPRFKFWHPGFVFWPQEWNVKKEVTKYLVLFLTPGSILLCYLATYVAYLLLAALSYWLALYGFVVVGIYRGALIQF